MVLIVVDQLRGSEIDNAAPLWQHEFGFKMLRERSRWFKNAKHGHARTETAAGHATIGTGLHPRFHGIIDKSIFLRDQKRRVSVCAFGTPPCSADALLEPTLGERLKDKFPGARVVAFANKGRSANLLAGRQADLVVWWDDDKGELVGRAGTSYRLPTWVRQHHQELMQQVGTTWELPKLPAPFDTRVDARDSEVDVGFGKIFPHTPREAVDVRSIWEYYPASDEVMIDLALRSLDEMQLGRHSQPDLLLVSLSSVDITGHIFDVDSLEYAAALWATDTALSKLVGTIQKKLGAQVVFALTSDHGVAPAPAEVRAQGGQSGRFWVGELQSLIMDALRGVDLSAELTAIADPYVYLDKISPQKKSQVLAATVAALQRHPRIYKAWSVDQLAIDPDPIARLVFENSHLGRSGDVAFVTVPNFFMVADKDADYRASHGSPWDYDRHVPVFLWGGNVSAKVVESEVAVIDLVRTLADLLGLPADPRGGRALLQ